MDEELEVRDLSADEVESKIQQLEAEITEHKAELEEIKVRLGGEVEGETAESAPVATETAEGSEELKTREAELSSMILEKQMTIVALKKRLNDLVSNEAMQNYNREE